MAFFWKIKSWIFKFSSKKNLLIFPQVFTPPSCPWSRSGYPINILTRPLWTVYLNATLRTCQWKGWRWLLNRMVTKSFCRFEIRFHKWLAHKASPLLKFPYLYFEKTPCHLLLPCSGKIVHSLYMANETVIRIWSPSPVDIVPEINDSSEINASWTGYNCWWPMVRKEDNNLFFRYQAIALPQVHSGTPCQYKCIYNCNYLQ